MFLVDKDSPDSFLSVLDNFIDVCKKQEFKADVPYDFTEENLFNIFKEKMIQQCVIEN